MKRFLFPSALLIFFLSWMVFAQQEPDYADPANWVIRETDIGKACKADLFYVMPTIFSHKEKAYMQWQDDATLQKKALSFSRQQTGIFASYCRVFAPYYRQGEFRRVLKQIHLPPEQQTFLQKGCKDIRNAFRYYLRNYNKGRPFILFGFSQGAMALLEVMKEEFSDPAARTGFVAAYLIGYPRMPKKFPMYRHLRTAERADDTGVIISYNSQAPGSVRSYFTGKGEYFCINPVNWRTDGKIAAAKEHAGSRFFDRKSGKNMDLNHFVTAQVDPATGALIVIPQREGRYDSRVLGKGVYHLLDVNFFYHDLSANGRLRLKAFSGKKIQGGRAKDCTK